MWKPEGATTQQVAVLDSPDVRSPFQVSARVDLLPGVGLPATAPNTRGASMLRRGRRGAGRDADRRRSPTSPSCCRPASAQQTPFAASTVVTDVRKKAAAQAKSVKAVAVFGRPTSRRRTACGSFRTADGGAIVVAAIDRLDRFTVRKGAGVINPPPAYRALGGGMKKITKVATVQTVQMVVLVRPRRRARARSSCSGSPRIRWPSPARVSRLTESVTMSQPPGPSASSMSLRGAVDLAAVAAQAKRREQAAANAASGQPGPGRRPASSSRRPRRPSRRVVELSLSVPVVVDLRAELLRAEPAAEPGAGAAGRRVRRPVPAGHASTIDTNPRLAQVFQAQAVPSVVAVVKGQPVPLFQGALPEEQVRAYLDELLRVAEANGVTGTVPTGAAPSAAADADGAADAARGRRRTSRRCRRCTRRPTTRSSAATWTLRPPPTRRRSRSSPADDEAKAGLSQVNLLRRTEGADLQAARAAAAAAPQDPQAQILVADLDLLGGHVEDAFARLVDTVRVTSGDERNAVREHLVELFEVVGPADPRVVAARRALSAALY